MVNSKSTLFAKIVIVSTLKSEFFPLVQYVFVASSQLVNDMYLLTM